jgi:hypothetical protein
MSAVSLLVMGLATAIVCALPLVGRAFVAGPPPQKTGGFGEMTCHECHWDSPLNDPLGRLTLSGIPTTYTPGARYMITVELAHPALVHGGFQLSARFNSGARAGMNAGGLAPTDELTQIVADDAGRVSYIEHNEAGAATDKRGAAHWTFEWISPAEADLVIIHAAANASNGDDSPLGDFVYAASASSAPSGVTK